VIWVSREAEYFFKRGWTGFTDLPVRQSVRSPDATNGSRECAPDDRLRVLRRIVKRRRSRAFAFEATARSQSMIDFANWCDGSAAALEGAPAPITKAISP
jgi:hypothetical protein